MLSVLTLDHIENVFLYSVFSILYGHGKLDLKFVHGRAEKRDESTKICPKKMFTSEAEIAEELSRTTSFGENGLFSCGHICFGKQLLPRK